MLSTTLNLVFHLKPGVKFNKMYEPSKITYCRILSIISATFPLIQEESNVC